MGLEALLRTRQCLTTFGARPRCDLCVVEARLMVDGKPFLDNTALFDGSSAAALDTGAVVESSAPEWCPLRAVRVTAGRAVDRSRCSEFLALQHVWKLLSEKAGPNIRLPSWRSRVCGFVQMQLQL